MVRGQTSFFIIAKCLFFGTDVTFCMFRVDAIGPTVPVNILSVRAAFFCVEPVLSSEDEMSL